MPRVVNSQYHQFSRCSGQSLRPAVWLTWTLAEAAPHSPQGYQLWCPNKETTTDIIIMSNIRQVLYQRLSYATVYVTDLVQIAGQV